MTKQKNNIFMLGFMLIRFTELDAVIDEMMDNSTEPETGLIMWNCLVCQKSLKKKSHMRMHVESSHLEGLSQHCDLCGSTFKTRASLRTHFWKDHRQRHMQL